ncbi:hypothetical protein H2200_006537 [Cladophialophora chaetospira]|uniref:NAD(P)-binding protein n=1 Tax=Cladophialophora chaetospira TaxID=386627 RepID=A0AA38X8D8_9EURO|nr:hypothetical protein H2200_006537 [Cladophialophora chaetospira]
MSLPSPVKNYHTQPYAQIDPASDRLSTKGKHVVISGAGSGIGAYIAEAFAKSGASSISLLGRTEKTLLATKEKINTVYADTKVLVFTADISDESSLAKAFEGISSTIQAKLDVLIANAGYLPELAPVAKANLTEWYQGFEINVKGNFNLVRAFLPYAAEKAAVINVSTGITHYQAPGYSGYHASKLAAVKIFDYLHQEHPDFFVLSVHPGVFLTEMGSKAKEQGIEFPLDDIELPAHFVVWAVSPEAQFLNGKFVWAHWDIDELTEMRQEIEGTNKFTMGLLGFP